MYIYSGKYSAGTVRKFLSAPVQSDSDGLRIEGVVPSYSNTYSMQVVPSSGRNLLVKTGLCIIADKQTQSLSSQDVDQPGMYIAGVVDTDHAVTIASNGGSTRYDLVYAEVTENYFTVTNKSLTSNVATLTTSSTHGFLEGQTVIVTGVDETFDGQHVITAVNAGANTFSYAKTASDVSSVAVKPYMQIGSTVLQITNKAFSNSTGIATITTASNHGLTTASNLNNLITVRGVDTLFDGSHHILTAATNTITYRINRVPVPADVTSVSISSSNNYLARAAVPFAVKVLTGTSSTTPALPSNTNSIALARVTVANGASTINAGDISDRRSFTTTVGGVHFYDSSNTAIPELTYAEGSLRYDASGSAGVLEYFDGDNWQIFSSLTLFGTGVADTAAKSDHTHTNIYNKYLGISQVGQSASSGSYVFGDGLFRANLEANKTYIFEAQIPLTIEVVAFPQTISFGLAALDDVQSINYDFALWSTTESSSVSRIGYHSYTTGSASQPITSELPADVYNYFFDVSGVIKTSSATSVGFNFTAPYSDISYGIGAWGRFIEVGADTVTVINGTWS